MFNKLIPAVILGLVTIYIVGTTMASDEELPVPEAVNKLQVTKDALAIINKSLGNAEIAMQRFIDSAAESKIRKDTEMMLRDVNNPEVLAKIATISWTISSPQSASQRTFDIVYDFAFQEAIQRLKDINTKDSKMQLLKISSTVVLGPFEKQLINSSTK